MPWLLVVTPIALIAMFGVAVWMEARLLGRPARVTRTSQGEPVEAAAGSARSET